jgi:hypothetical protein
MPWYGSGTGGGSSSGSVAIRGSVADSSGLPTDAVRGDSYITRDSGHLFIYDDSSFVDAGPIQGPTGVTPSIVGGNVTTLPAGSAPTITLTKVGGTSYRLDLGMPAGSGDGTSSGPRPSFTYIQSTPIKDWTFTHTLGFDPTDMRIKDYADPNVIWVVDSEYDAASKTYVLHFPIAVSGEVTVY